MNFKNCHHDMFYKSDVPSLDLHGETRESTIFLVKQFIDDNWRIKNNRLIIVHGIGTGALKKQVHEVLKKDKRIASYYVNFFNAGCTFVELKENIDK